MKPIGIPDPGSERIEFSEWEPDPDAKDIYSGGLHYANWGTGPYFTLRPSIGGWRRRRIKTWTENGRLVGSWTWERRSN